MLSLNPSYVSTMDLCDFLKSDESYYSEGVRIIESDSINYLVSVSSVGLGKQSRASVDRIATVKCRRVALQYISGSTITSETMIKTSEKVSGNSVEFYEAFIDEIKENSSGFVEGMEVLCSWESSDGKTLFKAIYKQIRN